MKKWIPLTLLCLSASAMSTGANAKAVRTAACVSKPDKPPVKKKKTAKRVKKTAPASAAETSPNP